MTERDRDTPREDGKRGGEPTPQGPKSAGPGNLHGKLPDDSPDDLAVDVQSPPAEPASDQEAMARRVLDQAGSGPKAEGDAGPLGAARKDDDGRA
jgi:hypothetical protein